MADTKHYRWPLTPRSEEDITSVEEWTRRLTEDVPEAIIPQIDDKLFAVDSASRWRVFMGESLNSLNIFAAPTQERAKRMLKEDSVALTPSGQYSTLLPRSSSFDSDISSYTASISADSQFLAIYADSAAIVNRYVTLSRGGTVVAEGELPAALVIPLAAGDNDSIVITLRPLDPTNTGGEKVYTIALSRQNNSKLTGFWCKDSTDPNANNLNRIWAIDEDHPGRTNYDAVPPVLDFGEHNICKPEIRCYGVMVDVLQTYIHLNAVTDTGSYIIVSEYGSDETQIIDSRSVQPEAPHTLTDARFRLDPSKDGTQVIQILVANQETGSVGTYYLTVYRNRAQNAELKLQTWIKGNITTASRYGKDGVDYTADYVLYRKSDAMGMHTIELAVADGLVTTEEDATYTDWFNAVLGGKDVDGRSYLTPVLTGKTEKATGAYIITPDDIKESGKYMLVLQREGYLDYVFDNILVYKTWAPAEYDFSKVAMRAGDLNHDGDINDADADIFSQYNTAINNIYRELAARVVLAKIKHFGDFERSYTEGSSLLLSELNALTFQYDGADLDPWNFARRVDFYLSKTNQAMKREDMKKLEADYEFVAEDVGVRYLYAVLRYTDDNLDDYVDVVYRIGAITVSERTPDPAPARVAQCDQDAKAEQPADTEALTEGPSSTEGPGISEVDQLVEAILRGELELYSDELAAIVQNMVMASGNFRPEIMDFDGDGYPNNSDLSFILSYSGMDVLTTCYRDNPNARYETILNSYQGGVAQ